MNHATELARGKVGAPPSRRLGAWAIREGDWQATVFDHCWVNLLWHGNGTLRPRSDGLSRRDGGAPTAWIRFRNTPIGRLAFRRK